MKIRITSRFKKGFQRLTLDQQQVFQKQMELLSNNPVPPFHPSLRIKKIQGTSGIFECSINRDIRLTWQYHQSGYTLLRNIGKHDRTLKNP